MTEADPIDRLPLSPDNKPEISNQQVANLIPLMGKPPSNNSIKYLIIFVVLLVVGSKLSDGLFPQMEEFTMIFIKSLVILSVIYLMFSAS
jgi:hypothetical protein